MFETNRLCQLLGIAYPVLQGGMVWCSGWRLAAAVSEAGGLGVLGSGSMTPELLREHIGKVRAATSKPFGVKVPLMYHSAAGCAQVCLDEKVPVLITSAGSPNVWTAKAQALGMRVGHVVANLKFAQKAAGAGVDFVVAEGVEAGGHNGLEEYTTLVLGQILAGKVEVPLVLGGGFADGRGLLAALALGASGIQIGSRLACTVESSAHEAYKQHIASEQNASVVLTGRGWSPTRMSRNAFSDELMILERSGASQEELLALIGTGRARRGIFEGDLSQGELEIGQISVIFRDIPSVAEVFERLKQTYLEARAALEL